MRKLIIVPIAVSAAIVLTGCGKLAVHWDGEIPSPVSAR